MKKNLSLAGIMLALVGSLALAIPSWAQRPVWKQRSGWSLSRWVSAQGGMASARAISHPGAEDYHRLMEILVELSWLADPMTFPFFLEARVEKTALHVHGKVPHRSVAEQALKLARLNCPMKIIDHLKEQATLGEKPGPVPASALQPAAHSALSVSFPDSAPHFQVHSSNDGKVTVQGLAQNFEEKLAVSKELRRLNGCTCVVNLLHVATGQELARLPKKTSNNLAEKKETSTTMVAEIQRNLPAQDPLPKNLLAESAALRPHPASDLLPKLGQQEMMSEAAGKNPGNSGPKPSTSPPDRGQEFVLAAVAPSKEVQGTAGQTPAQPPVEPYESRGVVIIPDAEPVAFSPQQLKELIFRACGQHAPSVEVAFKSPKELEIQLRAHNQAEAARLARIIMQIPELLAYRVDIRVKVPR